MTTDPYLTELDELARQHQKDGVSGAYIGLIPIYRLTLNVRLRYVKTLDTISEYCMKFIAAGAKSQEDVQKHMGINDAMRERLFDFLLDQRWLQPIPHTPSQLTLTALGQSVLESQTYAAISNRRESFEIDPITLEAKSHSKDTFWDSSKVERVDRRLTIFPEVEFTPDADTLNTTEIRAALLASLNGIVPKEERLNSRLFHAPVYDSIDINAVLDSKCFFKPVPIFCIDNPEGNEAELRVCTDWANLAPSPSHTSALIASIRKGTSSFPVEVPPKETTSHLVDPKAVAKIKEVNEEVASKLTEAAASLNNLKNQKRRLQDNSPSRHRQTTIAGQFQSRLHDKIAQQEAEISNLKKQLRNQIQIRDDLFEIITNAEHRKLMLDAFRTATSQIILVTPWLKRNAITEEVVREMRKALSRGVKIFVGYGYDERDDTATQEAISYMNSLLKLGLKLRKMSSTHEKILICDTRFVVITSYNWLSFRQWKGHAIRREIGLICKLKGAVQTYIDELLPRFQTSA